MVITRSVVFVCDKEEFSGVKKIAGKVCLDVERITGPSTGSGTPKVQDAVPDPVEGPAEKVFFATLGQSPLAQKLADDQRLTAELGKIKGKRECYIFAVRSDKIIIIGSDKRGTIYGLFHLSELMGVSPLVDWCGVLPAKRESVKI